MKQLPPNKRNQLIMVSVIIAALIGAVYFFLISPQLLENKRIAHKTQEVKAQFEKMRSMIKQADATAARLTNIDSQLSAAEKDVAKGDTYAWTYNVIREFKSKYKVNIQSIGQPTITKVDMLPDFPYKQVRLTLNGTAYFHDLGKFVADFENNFPHTRLENLVISPDMSPGEPSEQLAFRMDMVALVKSSN